jgi:hypothetical protein
VATITPMLASAGSKMPGARPGGERSGFAHSGHTKADPASTCMTFRSSATVQ